MLLYRLHGRVAFALTTQDKFVKAESPSLVWETWLRQFTGLKRLRAGYTFLENVELLKNIVAFSTLSALELIQVSKLCTHASHETGDTVIREGDVGDCMYVVKTGRVGVYKSHAAEEAQKGAAAENLASDNPMEELVQLRTGEHFGEISLIDSGPRSATVKALEPTTLIRLSASDFQVLLERDVRLQAKVYKAFAKTLCQRLRHTSDMLMLDDGSAHV